MGKIENTEMCKKCGGVCCKKSGCDYFVSDFDNFKIDYLEEKLNEGKISIVSLLRFNKLPDGKVICVPHLFLRARNTNRDIIDLFSLKTTCRLLTDSGCSYSLEERPSGGAVVKPDLENGCFDKNRLEEIMKWEQYQKVLDRLVKRFTGKSVRAKLEEDVENFFYDMINKNFEGVSDIELVEVREMLPILLQAFPECYKNAKKRSEERVVLSRKGV